MAFYDDALRGIGVDIQNASVSSTVGAIEQYGKQTLGFDPVSLAKTVITAGKAGLTKAGLNDVYNQFKKQESPNGITAAEYKDNINADGKIEFSSVDYASDMVEHQPKLKFFFKVKFIGFGDETFYYYVHTCDKPKVAFHHQDANYYNFRTKILTHTTYESVNMSFFDEIENSVHRFFHKYTALQSGQGNGSWGINKGFGSASSSRYYDNGYSKGKAIVLEQIFAHGTSSNRFTFYNPRIESFDFDSLDMSDSGFSSLGIRFNYDALECSSHGGVDPKSAATGFRSTIHSWGQKDIHRGSDNTDVSRGSGENAYQDYGETNITGERTIGGGRIKGSNMLIDSRGPSINEVSKRFGFINNLPPALRDAADKFGGTDAGKSLLGGYDELKDKVSSYGDTVSSNIADTISNIKSGFNSRFGGSSVPTYNLDGYY